MLAAGTMITVRKRQEDEALGLLHEMQTLLPTTSGEELDLLDVPQPETYALCDTECVSNMEALVQASKQRAIDRGVKANHPAPHVLGHSVVHAQPDPERSSKGSGSPKSPESIGALGSPGHGEGHHTQQHWRRNKVLSRLESGTDADIVMVRIEQLRDKLYFAFEGMPSRADIDAPWPAITTATAWFSLAVVAVSCATLALSTVYSLTKHTGVQETLFALETVTTFYFIVDYAVRLATSRNRWRWARRISNVIDLLTIVPYFVDIGLTRGNTSEDINVSAIASVRVVRLTRVARVMKLSRHSGGLKDVVFAVTNSHAALSLLLLLVVIALMLFPTMVFYAEQTQGATFDDQARQWVRGDGRYSPFQSIFHSMWWCIVTMTTVGYGDDVPSTWAGKLVGAVTMICGVMAIAFPTVILSASFHQAYSTRLLVATLKSMAEKEKERAEQRKQQGRQRTRLRPTDSAVFDESRTSLSSDLDKLKPKARLFDKKEPFHADKDRVPLECALAPRLVTRDSVLSSPRHPPVVQASRSQGSPGASVEEQRLDDQLRMLDRRTTASTAHSAAAASDAPSGALDISAEAATSHDPAPLVSPCPASDPLLSSGDAVQGSRAQSPPDAERAGSSSGPRRSRTSEPHGSLRPSPERSASGPGFGAWSLPSAEAEDVAAAAAFVVGRRRSSSKRKRVTPPPALTGSGTAPNPAGLGGEAAAGAAPGAPATLAAPDSPSPDGGNLGSDSGSKRGTPPRGPRGRRGSKWRDRARSVEFVSPSGGAFADPALPQFCTTPIDDTPHGGDRPAPKVTPPVTPPQEPGPRKGFSPTRRGSTVIGTTGMTNRRAQQDDVIQAGVLYYAPVLQLECVPGTDVVQGRVTKAYPVGGTVTLRLLLDSEVVRLAYYAKYVDTRAMLGDYDSGAEADLKESGTLSGTFSGGALSPSDSTPTFGKRVSPTDSAPLSPPDELLTPVDGETSEERRMRELLKEDKAKRRKSRSKGRSAPEAMLAENNSTVAMARSAKRKGRAVAGVGAGHQYFCSVRAVAVKTIKRLAIRLHHTLPVEHPDSELLGQVHLCTDRFEAPRVSAVPIVLNVPSKACLTALNRHWAALVFAFDVDYSGPHTVGIDLAGMTASKVTRTTNRAKSIAASSWVSSWTGNPGEGDAPGLGTGPRMVSIRV